MDWIVGGVLAVLALVWRLINRSAQQGVAADKSIVVDGSNVMHWGGDPSEKVLRGVIASLMAKGWSPHVVFDANAGYKLRDHFMDENEMARVCKLPARQITVVDSGVVADGVILQMAKAQGLRVVSNDRYRDWSVKYPLVKKRGRMMRGTWKGGNVIWR